MPSFKKLPNSLLFFPRLQKPKTWNLTCSFYDLRVASSKKNYHHYVYMKNKFSKALTKSKSMVGRKQIQRNNAKVV